jgi:TolB-like protein/DNA-binding winged helix-turn-helix (wHTH) protein
MEDQVVCIETGPSEMRADFRLGDWIIRPRRDCIERGDEIVHIHAKPMAVLECLAAAGGDVVTRNELFDTVWPGVIVTDDALTQCVVELRKAFGDPAHDAQIIRTIARRGFCLVPPVSYLTEAEMAAGDKPGQAGAGVIGTMKRSTRASLVAALAIVLALALYWFLDKPREVVLVSPVPSIAVLPFADMSESGNQEYFADGLSEELLNSLARIQGLKVTGRTSSFHFKGKNEDLQVIAESLGVNHVLEGSVRKDGERLRITAQLLDASSGFHLWSESYDRELGSIFAVQDEIAAAIVGALKDHLGLQLEMGSGAVTTSNTAAHDAYLRGRYLVSQPTRASIEAAVREFKQAITLDPDYALAHAELAMTFLRLTRNNFGDWTATEASARAAPHAELAMALDPTLAEAHVATGWVKEDQENITEAQEYYRQAIQINPNYSLAYVNLGHFSVYFGRYEEAFTLQETALRVDPLSWAAIRSYSIQLIIRNRFAEVEQLLEKYASIYPPHITRMRGRLHSMGGQWANFFLIRLELKRSESEPWIPGNDARRRLAILGLDKEALTISGPPQGGATVHRMLGRPEAAVITAEASLAEDPMHAYARPRLGLGLAAAGEYARARPILEETWQRSNRRVTRTGLFSYEMAAALIAARRDAGAEAEVGELVAALRDNVRRCHEAGITASTPSLSPDFEAGLADYLSGERERGLALIAKAAEEGYFILPNEAYLQTLYDDPGFAPILAGQKGRQARERQRFLDVVCNDTRYAEIWQPAEGTCERFAAAGGN